MAGRGARTSCQAGPVPGLDVHAAEQAAGELWAQAMPVLTDYVRIPNVSPAYCPTWKGDGHMEEAVTLLSRWCSTRDFRGASVDVVRVAGRTPTIVVDIPAHDGGRDDDAVLLYGHFDKQPAMTGWRQGLGPWEPVVEGDRFYGRGTADDGYAVFCALVAIETCRRSGGTHNRCIVVIEGSEESGSVDLPAYLDELAGLLAPVSLVVGLDSESVTYDRLWTTVSLRGLVVLDVTVRVLEHGTHSGLGGGVVPSAFRLARRLLDRIEDPDTGDMLVPEVRVPVPVQRRHDVEAMAAVRPPLAYPVLEGVRLSGSDEADRLARLLWQPTMTVTGFAGMPPPELAGNVLVPAVSLRLSVRLAPATDAAVAADALCRTLTDDSPNGANVEVHVDSAESGWQAPEEAPWLTAALDAASLAGYGNPAGRTGVGASIPFIGMLGDRFPEASIVVTGALGTDSNPHGPNEFLHLPTARRLSVSVAHLLDSHARR